MANGVSGMKRLLSLVLMITVGCSDRTTPQAETKPADGAPGTATASAETADADERPQDVLYAEDFENLEPGKVPDDWLVLDGDFAVRQGDDGRVLELPGSPLSTFCALFGPAVEEGVAVRVRVKSTRKGRRYPSFAVGLGGVSGYQLRVSPGKDALEIVHHEEVVASAEYTWESSSWTVLTIQSEKAGPNAWRLSGKAWTQGGTEPRDWQITHETADPPPPGRAMLCAAPYAGTEIRFDDLRVDGAVTEPRR